LRACNPPPHLSRLLDLTRYRFVHAARTLPPICIALEMNVCFVRCFVPHMQSQIKTMPPMAAILLILSYHFFGRQSCCLKSGPELCCGTSPWKTSRSLLVFYEAGLPSSVPNTPHSQQLRSQGLNIDPMSIAWVISNYYGPCPWLPPAKYRKNSPRLGAFQIVRWVREVA